jgi:transaldolase
MKIFIDSGNLKEIESLVPIGIIDGITTNPSLLAKEGGDYKALLKRICDIVQGPTSAEVVATDLDGMLREGRHWAGLHKNITVKVPCTLDGLKATRALSADGHKVNVTLIFSATQALLAAKAGATFVSPFVGRLDDIAAPGMELVADIVQIFDNYDFDCEVLAASLRHPIHVVEAAKIGAHVGTMPMAVLTSLLKHPLTDIGLKRFLDDWEKAKKEMGTKARVG